jgi:hypothetical protein
MIRKAARPVHGLYIHNATMGKSVRYKATETAWVIETVLVKTIRRTAIVLLVE